MIVRHTYGNMLHVRIRYQVRGYCLHVQVVTKSIGLQLVKPDDVPPVRDGPWSWNSGVAIRGWIRVLLSFNVYGALLVDVYQ